MHYHHILKVDEWRSKWLLEKKWQTKTFEEIKEAMKSINDHVRLTAVSAAGKVILDKRNGTAFSVDLFTMLFSYKLKIFQCLGRWQHCFQERYRNIFKKHFHGSKDKK